MSTPNVTPSPVGFQPLAENGQNVGLSTKDWGDIVSEQPVSKSAPAQPAPEDQPNVAPIVQGTVDLSSNIPKAGPAAKSTPTTETHNIVAAPDGSKVAFPKSMSYEDMHKEMTNWWDTHLQHTTAAWHSVANAVSNASQALGLPASLTDWQDKENEFMRDPGGTTVDAVGTFLHGLNSAVMALGPGNDENKALVQQAQAEWNHGKHLAAVTTLTPLIGPNMAKAVKQAQSRDYSGSFGTTVGTALPFVAGAGEASPETAAGESAETAPGQTFYHGANAEGTKAIERTGAISPDTLGQAHLTPDKSTADAYARTNGGKTFSVNENDIPSDVLQQYKDTGRGPMVLKSGHSVPVNEVANRRAAVRGLMSPTEIEAAMKNRRLQDIQTPFDATHGASETINRDIVNRPTTPQPVTLNASGESVASQEAINRAASQKAQGIKTYRVDSRSGNAVPVLGVDAADATAKPYEYIVQVKPTGEVQIQDSGRGARPLDEAKLMRQAAPDTVGSAVSATQDTALFQKAKAELGPDASLSAIAQRAQAMKIGTPMPVEARSVGAASATDLNTKPDVPPFYSKAEQVINDKVSNNASGESVKALLKNNGVKDDEMKWAGLDDFLKDKPKVSKADLQQFIKENQISLQDVDLGTPRNFTVVPNNAETAHAGEPMFDVIDPTNGLTRFTGTKNSAQEYVSEVGASNPTKYDKWTVPGEKENYQEKLLTLPAKESPELTAIRQEYKDAEVKRLSFLVSGEAIPGDVELRFQDAQNAMRKMKNEESTNKEYVAPHFGGSGGDTPTNIVAHVRFDDRPAVDGKKTLFMEEAQSDWHSAGRHEGYSGSPKEIEAAKKALQDAKAAKTAFVQSVVDRVNATPYATPEDLAEYLAEYDAIRNKIYDRNKPLTPEERDAENLRIKELDSKIRMNNEGPVKIDPNSELMSDRIRTAMTSDELNKFDKLNTDVASKYQATKALQGAVPDAPFKQSWHELVMKRMLRQAAEKGYDQLAWTTGDQQAALYDLTKHIGKVEYNPDEGELYAYNPSGHKVIDENVEPTVEALTPYMGEALAEKLVDKIQDYVPSDEEDEEEPETFDRDSSYDYYSQHYSVDERPMEGVPERDEFNDYRNELASTYGYEPHVFAQDIEMPIFSDLKSKLAPEELNKLRELKSAAETAEQEQEDNPTMEYYVNNSNSGDDYGPYDSEREAERAMEALINSDVDYDEEDFEPEEGRARTKKKAQDLPSIEGLDLKTGGEFHHLLYDKMIPSFLKKYAKKWGAEVGTTELKGMGSGANQKVHSIPITPQMRLSVMKEGQPIAKKEEKKRPFAAPETNVEAANISPRLRNRMQSALA